MAELPDARGSTKFWHEPASSNRRPPRRDGIGPRRGPLSPNTEMNRLSLALGTAIQFEAVLRQKDVIGG